MKTLKVIISQLFIIAAIFLVLPNGFECRKEIEIEQFESSYNCPNFNKEIVVEMNWQEYVVTAYCSCENCCGKTDCITSTGTTAQQGRTIAVDPNVIPYGSKVYIDGYGMYIAEDCGGAIKENRIDIYFENHEDALDFGKKELKVIILEGKNEQRKSTNRNAF